MPVHLRRPLLVALAASFAATAGCSGAGSPAVALVDAPVLDRPGESRCGIAKSQAQPLIVEWPPAERGKLEVATRRGLVAVRYIGCEMQVLGRCNAPGQYGYAPLTRKHDRVTMRDADELYANIPVYAAKFEGTLEKSGELDVDMTIVGRMESERTSFRQDELSDGCEGATHVITAITVGAFEFFSGAAASVGGGASALGAEAGGNSASTRRLLANDGDAEVCTKATLQDKAPPDGCGAMLRVEVVPLGEAKRAEAVCPEGATWDGAQCVRNHVVTKLECPAGTSLQGTSCVPNVSTTCSAGLRYLAGQGCVPLVAAQPAPAPKPQASAAPEAGRMVRIAGGTFQMGSNNGDADEKPVHAVRVGTFSMDVTEVTVDAYAACVSAGRCAAPDTGEYCNWQKVGRGRHPINCVDWNQATAYCGYAGKRLPTEEEWEYAARGSAGREHPWGSAAPGDQLCWGRYGSGKPNSTCEAGSYSSGGTPEGLLDMAGNVWEWTSSPYCPYSSNNCTEAARVDRGGSWYDTDPSGVRGADRSLLAPSDRTGFVGFRCARAD